MIREVYKLVDKDMTSMADRTDLMVTYAIGQVTYPKLGKLFAFKDRDATHMYTDKDRRLFLARAEVSDVEAPYMLPYHKCTKEVKQAWWYWWTSPKVGRGILAPVNNLVYTPSLTVLCDWIELLEEIEC